MYTLIGFYTGPEREKGILDSLLGRQGSVIYLLNPQLYKAGNPLPLTNLGVYKINCGNKELTDTDLEAALNVELRQALGVGIKVGQRVVPAENIEITLERSDE